MQKFQPDCAFGRIRNGTGRTGRASSTLTLTVAAILALSTVDTSAQARLLIEADAGFTTPAGELARRQEFGTTLGLNIGYRLAEGWAVKANTDIEMLEGTFVSVGERSAPMTLTHFGIGAERRVIRSGEGHWEVLGEVGAGRTNMRTTGVGSGRVVDRPFGHTCNSSFGGLRALVHPSRKATVVMRGRIRWMNIGRSKAEELAGSMPFSSAFTVPITVGLVVRP